jgi:D-serine deaminase-like pyridoxal phosphate-dependent protein
VSAAHPAGVVPEREPAAPELVAVPTPVLLVDRPVLSSNIRAMADRAAAAGVSLWPHAKTHKSSEIAREQLAAGADGITVATVAEAETMAATGVRKLLLAYPPVDSWRLERIIALASVTQLTVTLDDVETAQRLDAACRAAETEIAFLWEVDCGNHRCGSPPGLPTVELVSSAVAQSTHARYAGLMTFAGHAYAARDDRELRAIARDEVDALRATAGELRQRGIQSPVLSIGSTPTVRRLDPEARDMQIRPGNYVFNDATQVALGVASVGECALTVLTTVISRPSPDRVIFDAGSKALSADRMTTRTEGYGIVLGEPGVQIERLFEEHAIARVDPSCPLEIGSRVRVIPNHACTTANLHSSMLLMQDGEIADVWSIAARGWT